MVRSSFARAAALSLFLLLLIVAADPAEARAKLRCASSGKTILANGRARVFAVDPHPRDEIRLAGNFRAYGCVYRGARVFGLGTADTGGGPESFKLAGRFVAFDVPICQHNDCSGRLHLVDLRSARTRKSAAFGQGALPATSVVVNASGAAAWIRPINGNYEVRELGSAGERLLDSGGDVGPHSLAASSGTVYWKRGGGVFSAALR
jgi:hypothetical protein